MCSAIPALIKGTANRAVEMFVAEDERGSDAPFNHFISELSDDFPHHLNPSTLS